MPKVKLAEYARKKAPPVDWLWAAVLERKMVMRMDLKTMAKLAGVPYERMRKLIGVTPWDWPKDAREKVCDAFGLRPIRSVEAAPPDGWEGLK